MSRGPGNRRRSAPGDTGDGGVAAVWTAIVAGACLLVVGLVLDGGAVLRARSASFDLAGGAARAAAQDLDQDALARGEVTLDRDRAAATAHDWLATRGTSGQVAVNGDAVTVTVHRDVALRILQPARVTVRETATAQARHGRPAP